MFKSKGARVASVMAVGAMLLAVAACGGNDSSGSSSGGSSSGGGSAAKKVGVILPDATTSPRWESNDRPALKSAFDKAGIQSNIQNAGGDKSKFATLCDSMINSGVQVLMIVNLDSDSGSACLKKAQAAGVQTIDYDRLTLGGGATYYVSFDNVKVGELMGHGLQKCLTDEGKTKANIVYINGDPTDNNAALFKSGYVEALKPKVDSGDYKVVGTRPATGTPPRPAPPSSSSTPRTRATSTASSPPTTRWPAASSRSCRRTASRARSRSPARTRVSRVCSGSSQARSA